MKKLIVIVILALLPACANATIVEISAATDKPTYLLDEEITISVTAYNPNPEPVTLTFSSSTQASYFMDNIYDWKEHHGAWLWLTHQQIEGLSSHTWTLVHGVEEMQTYPLAVGPHTFVGEILGYGQSTPVEFEVIPEPTSLLLLAMGMLGIRTNRHKS